ncbi:hypothetical protein B0A55_13399 [Friedmanniomyces simplex]|uniref:Uncharacterized protein n=1 Tax=Friedmanniomyces simplex TaxID=329884 RepID=A0A4U0VR70_9PEZI|nr:hypothetical protein B0A55_13399 [Friedmanniomyces simplex]
MSIPFQSNAIGQGMLKIIIGVTQHADMTCCKSIFAGFTLRPNGQAEQNVGCLTGYIIDKRTKGVPGKKKRWVQSLLRDIPGRADDFRCVTPALCTLYNIRGARRPQLYNNIKTLGTQKIVYIDELVINGPRRGGGLGTAAFNGFHTLLRMFKGDYDLRRNMMLLQPDILDAAHTVTRSPAAIQQDPVRFYTNCSIFGPGELRTVLDVAPHPKLTCVNIITGEFFFRQGGQPDQQKMGNIKAFVINKTTPGLRGRGIKLRNRWIQTLLDYKLIDPQNPEYSLSGALSTLYNAAGARRPIFKSIDKKLKTRRIVYIDSFQIDMAYRRGGTGTVAFDDFQKVLRQFTGVYSPS